MKYIDKFSKVYYNYWKELNIVSLDTKLKKTKRKDKLEELKRIERKGKTKNQNWRRGKQMNIESERATRKEN